MDESNKENSMYARISAAFPNSAISEPSHKSTLALAYIGDTVYDLYVRSYLISKSDGSAHDLHMCAKKLVCAKAQAAAYEKICDTLTDEEQSMFKRGRNSHIGTIPKSCSVAEYRCATGVEALFGYLYLSGEDMRISSLTEIILKDAIFTAKPAPKPRKN